VPPVIIGSAKLETFWIVMPFGLCVVIFLWAASVYFQGAVPPEDSLEIYVVGMQCMWKIQHTGGSAKLIRCMCRWENQ
jgi:cytochrome c oxidase subunit 2